MENLFPPLIILLCVIVIVVLVLRRGAKRAQSSAEAALASGPDAAEAASARLTEEQHRIIYSLIAQGLIVQAIAGYREATGAKLIEARNAVLLMERYPQAYGARGGAGTEHPTAHADAEPTERSTEPVPAERAPAEPASPRPATPQPGGEESPAEIPLSPALPAAVVPGGGAEGRSTTRFPYRYRAIVSNGRQTLEVASNLLNDQIYEEIKALAQIGDAEDAAQMLWKHSDISIEEARAFVELL
ncbi:hypothetical protein [Sinomonas sp. ASV322]|uniref:hypothetical protein n=1 Tax=Sinomonas sp. ASV322 TaxID=3041920 RepID=UPI0027DC0204|nr:hypothetical protein [Sinomonas sp. ASV322]MDQ4503962.1 hypothetical protein [Sinomonas sp. ASV322]